MQHRSRHYAWIDSARGYAVLMVIACHMAYEYPELPYPVKRVATSGWFGVQLFFLASCLTLLASWNSEVRRNGSASARGFFIRRLFRIAPAYYAAAIFYYFVTPPLKGFDVSAALYFASFINAWFPSGSTTMWGVVPGGWSVSVEFAFYFLFPLFATLVTSLPRAILVFMAATVVGIVANLAEWHAFSATYPPVALSNFLFFWPPNQASVFAMGAVLYFLMRHPRWPAAWIARHATVLGIGAIIAFCALDWVPTGHFLGAQPYLPAGQAVCVPLCVFLVALSGNPRLFVNPLMAFVGKISFSAYLLHFSVLVLVSSLPGLLHTHAHGMGAIAAYAVGMLFGSALTCAGSWATHRWIEAPMIEKGRLLSQRMESAVVVVRSA